MLRRIVWLILLAVVAAGGFFAWALLAPVTPSEPTYVMLRPGYSTHRIAAELKGAGIVRSEKAFILWHYLHPSRSLKAGEYLFDKSANTIEVQKRLEIPEVVVAPLGEPAAEPRSVIAAAAGDHLSHTLRPDMKIGLGWGETLSRMLGFIEERYGVNVPDEELLSEEFASVDGIARTVVRLNSG